MAIPAVPPSAGSQSLIHLSDPIRDELTIFARLGQVSRLQAAIDRLDQVADHAEAVSWLRQRIARLELEAMVFALKENRDGGDA